MSSDFPSSDEGASVDLDARPSHRFRPLVMEYNRGFFEVFLSPPNAMMATSAHGQMPEPQGCPGMRCQDVAMAIMRELRPNEECMGGFRIASKKIIWNLCRSMELDVGWVVSDD